MVRLGTLLDLAPRLAAAADRIRVVLVQIQEAHTTRWPLGMTDHPEPQASLEERMERARSFRTRFALPSCFRLLVDPWTDPFEQRFRAWPDCYVMVSAASGDGIRTVEAQSTYSMDALVITDYAQILTALLEAEAEAEAEA